MLKLDGYTVTDQIDENLDMLIYRGYRTDNKQPVIIKILKDQYVNPQRVARLHDEYELNCQLKYPGVIQVYDLQPHHHTWVLIGEDIQGDLLKNIIVTKSVNLTTWLSFAIQLVNTLADLHDYPLIYNNLNPSNIWVNLSLGQIKLTSFNLSSRLPQEYQLITPPTQLEEILTYSAPEQTGRINRVIDYRTDWYLFGLVFYEMLVGYSPVKGNNAAELLDWHIAQSPVLPSAIKANIPLMISNIIMKLLAKSAEDRYQSALSLKMDLHNCLQQLQETNQIKPFELGQMDIAPQLSISQKLYGRTTELNALSLALEGNSNHEPNFSKIILISGAAGIGKTALVKEIYPQLTQLGNYFIQGKFEPAQYPAPRSALVQAITHLILPLLTENSVTAANWRHKLLAALVPNAQLIIEIIPELEQLIGKQPPLPTVGATAAHHRFNWTWLKFIQVFCQAVYPHPLVICLDDLQWADIATFELIELTITATEIKNLLIIGTYQDDEVNHNHPLVEMLNRLPKTIVVNHMALTPLNLVATTEWLMATLSHEKEVITPLAEWLIQVTQGEPLVIQQLLKILVAEHDLQLIYPENNPATEKVSLAQRGYWHWDIAAIIAKFAASNQFELITARIKKLPPATQHLLGLAAAIGNQLDLEQLALIYAQPIANTYQDLLPALEMGLIIKYQSSPTLTSSPQLAFYHDNIRQVAYAASKMNKLELHLRLGRLWLSHSQNQEPINNIFAIVEHLNTGRSLLVESAEILELARLNLVAGQQAKATLAYAAAQTYLTAGLAGITANDWREHKQLALDLYQTGAEIESLNGNVETAKMLIQIMLAQTQTVVEQIEIYNLLITQHIDQKQPQLAITVGYQVLQRLQIELPQHDLPAALEQELEASEPYWRDKTIMALLDESEMTQPEPRAAIAILSNIAIAAAITAQTTLFNFIHTKVVHLALKYGQVAQSALSFAYYGLQLSQLTQNYQRGYEFALFALKLSQKFHYQPPQAQIYLILENLLPWVTAIKSIKMINQEGQQASLAVGDLQSFGHFLINALLVPFCQGEPLNLLQEKLTDFLSLGSQIHPSPTTDIIMGYQLLVNNLLGKTANKLVFTQDTLTETQYLTTCQQNTNWLALGIYQTFKAKILYLAEQLSEALDCSHQAEQYLSHLTNPILLGNYYCYRALILLAMVKQASPEAKSPYQTQIATHQQQLKTWAATYPDNFQHQYQLVAAESASLFDNPWVAVDLYDNAIYWANTHEFIVEAALANELAARFWLNRGKETFAQLYLTKAYAHYQHWGAKHKLANLLATYPTHLITINLTSSDPSAETIPLSDAKTPPPLAAASMPGGKDNYSNLIQIMTASQTISEEIRLNSLITKIMQIVVEQASAEQGWLILLKNFSQSELSVSEININEPATSLDSKTAPNEAKPASPSVKIDELLIEAYATRKKVQLLKPIPLKWLARSGNARQKLAKKIINQVAQTQAPMVINEASQLQLFHDVNPLPPTPLSILAVPISKSKQLIGIFYLENNRSNNIFTSECLTVLKLLATQIAISIENALFYTRLEQARFAEIQSRHLAEQARQDAEIASRAKTAFLTNMSHELRTPLNAILGYSEIIQEEAEELGYEGILSDLEKIQTAGIQLLGLISDILDISKIEADKIELNLSEFAVTQLVEDMVTTIQLMVEMEGNTLTIQYDPDLDTLYADYHKVGQILLNLLNNASKFTRQGTITLTVTHETLFSMPDAVFEEDDFQLLESEWIFFQIADTGIGIPPERIDSIFEAFTQADNSSTREYGGTGLGLTISDRLCRAMGGYITVSSEVGKGSIFTVQLPTRVMLPH
jgi:predicted ATPase/signal transduction histidine kinase